MGDCEGLEGVGRLRLSDGNGNGDTVSDCDANGNKSGSGNRDGGGSVMVVELVVGGVCVGCGLQAVLGPGSRCEKAWP